MTFDGVAEEEMIKKTAKAIVKKIIEDISDRSGLGNEWENIDKETQKEIKDTWVKIVISGM